MASQQSTQIGEPILGGAIRGISRSDVRDDVLPTPRVIVQFMEDPLGCLIHDFHPLLPLNSMRIDNNTCSNYNRQQYRSKLPRIKKGPRE